MKITKSYLLPFDVVTVFNAWVSSETVIAPATSMDILAEPGGHYRLRMNTPKVNAINEGVFLVFQPNNRVVYTWEWNKDGEVTQIDVTFAAENGSTQIYLVHSGFTSTASHAMHDDGWDSYIDGLKEFLDTMP